MGAVSFEGRVDFQDAPGKAVLAEIEPRAKGAAKSGDAASRALSLSDGGDGDSDSGEREKGNPHFSPRK